MVDTLYIAQNSTSAFVWNHSNAFTNKLPRHMMKNRLYITVLSNGYTRTCKIANTSLLGFFLIHFYLLPCLQYAPCTTVLKTFDTDKDL